MKELSESEILERKIFDDLHLSVKEREYIWIESDDSVRLSFPISIDGIYAGGAQINLDEQAEIDLYEKIVEFYMEQLSRGGFSNNTSSPIPSRCIREASFYKDFTTEEEARDSIKWLVDFKKRFGI